MSAKYSLFFNEYFNGISPRKEMRVIYKFVKADSNIDTDRRGFIDYFTIPEKIPSEFEYRVFLLYIGFCGVKLENKLISSSSSINGAKYIMRQIHSKINKYELPTFYKEENQIKNKNILSNDLFSENILYEKPTVVITADSESNLINYLSICPSVLVSFIKNF